MRKAGKIIVALGLTSCFLVPLAACGGDGGRTRLDFQFTGESSVQKVFKECIDAYNDTQGAEDKIKVRGINVPLNGNKSKLKSVMSSSSGPDVAVATDRHFKSYTNNYLDITDLISQSVLDDLYPSQEIRYHYNSQKTTSHASDPRYGLPVYNDSTVLYYNRTAMNQAGVKCISVEESELDAFNNGGKDHNGKTKTEYGIPAGFTVPKKGFYRENPYVKDESDYSGSTWQAPASGELMIFNDRIACNWDEIEDVGLINTAERNSAAQTTYGYYTEWWFNYGWSVGGDCLEDMSDGNGNWVYSHADQTPNYIVKQGQTYTGAYTGTVYQAGETLDFKDILNAQKTDTISYTTENSTTFYYTINGNRAHVRSEIEEAAKADGALQELPSIYEAFSRFCFLSTKGGLGVCPSPALFNETPSSSYFSQGKVALLVETYSKVDTFSDEDRCTFDWGIARMPQYKTYTEPENPSCDEVATSGKIASHSEGYCVVIRKNTKRDAEALKFVEWLLTKGQDIFAEKGFNSVCKSDAQLAGEKMGEMFGIKNTDAVIDSLSESQAGDWWYLKDEAWIDTWSIPLNTKVRYGEMSFDQYIYQYIDLTNSKLENYKY